MLELVKVTTPIINFHTKEEAEVTIIPISKDLQNNIAILVQAILSITVLMVTTVKVEPEAVEEGPKVITTESVDITKKKE